MRSAERVGALLIRYVQGSFPKGEKAVKENEAAWLLKYASSQISLGQCFFFFLLIGFLSDVNKKKAFLFFNLYKESYIMQNTKNLQKVS